MNLRELKTVQKKKKLLTFYVEAGNKGIHFPLLAELYLPIEHILFILWAN